ncbi:GIY-YIG nuclease family protein [Priestia megaterium]|uniref:GIY-YIG nuclease family protein n=1 Tax=Priestia megaterium TaxID=1404 RepID=UPI002E1ECB65|nr:GIY-YIG nuclease family protein [Priestia megaterium]
MQNMQWSRRITYTLKENVYIFDEKELEKHSGPGVYVLKDKKDNILYIGQAENLSERIKKHIRGTSIEMKVNKAYKYIYNVDLYILANKKAKFNRYYIEIWLMNTHNPPFNSDYTPEKGNKQKMEEKRQRYFDKVKNHYISRNHWSGYEKLAYFERLPLEDIVLMISEGLFEDRENTYGVHIADKHKWYSTIKKSYIARLKAEYQYTEEEINQLAWEIGQNRTYPNLKALLPKKMSIAGDTQIKNNYGSGFELPVETERNRGQRRPKR